MVGQDNVTFTFRIDSAKAQATLRQLESQVRKLGGTATSSKTQMEQFSGSIDKSGNRAAASAVNFQTATNGMLNLSTAAVQTFTSISNLDRANNRAKMSIIAVARAEDLLNNKEQRLLEMREAGITSGGKYANMQREIATATADLTVKQEKQKIEQAAVNDIYMLFATNIANVTISSMQTITILLGQDRVARLGVAAANKLMTLSLKGHAAVQVASNIQTKQAIFATQAWSVATFMQIKATQGLTVAMKGLMMASLPLLAITAGLTAAFAIHESNILGTKDALDELMGVEKDFESQVKGARDGIEDFDDSLGGLNSTLGSSLPDSFESATKVMIAFNNALRSTKESAHEAEVAVNNFYTSTAGGRGGSFKVTNPPPPSPQINQHLRNKKTGRHFSTPSGGGQNEALANALSATGAFLMADPFAGSYAHADRGDNRGRELIPVEIKPQIQSRRGSINNAVASTLPQSVEQPKDTTHGNALYKEGPNMHQQFQLGNASGGMTNIPSIQDMASNMGISEEALEQALKDGQVDIKQLEVANQILNGDLMTIKDVKDFVELTKFKQYTPALEADRLALEKAKEQDKKFGEIFRERYMGSGVSIDKVLNELGKLEPERMKRFNTKNLTFVDGVGFDLSTDQGLKQHQKFMQAKLGQFIPTVDPLSFAGIKNKQDTLTNNQYLRFLGGQGLQQGQSNTIINNKLLSKIRNGEIKGNRAEVLLELGIDIGNAANNYSTEEAMRIGTLQQLSKNMSGMSGGFTDAFLGTLEQQGQAFRNMAGLNNASAMTGGLIGGKTNFGTGFFKSTGATAAYQVARGSIRASQGFYDGIRRKDSFNNGLGGLIMNQINNLKGSGRMVYSSSHRDIYKNKVTIPGRAIISQAIQMGMKGNSEFMDMINAIPDVDRESEDNMRQAYAAIGAASSIAEQYVNMINSNMSAIGFGSSMIARANTAGFSGHGLYHNIGLLAATKRTNFNNTEVVEESKSKLSLTNSQVFAIRFNSTRGDAELQDRLRYVDQLESMSSGTSPL
jgi:hypothetical protein